MNQYNTEESIQAHLAKILLKERKHWMAIGNVNGFYVWECDLLSLTKSLYLSEYEIKITFADFKADINKDKHEYFEKQREYPNSIYYIPNYLWYVVVWRVLSGFYMSDLDNILPEYAGLMLIYSDGSLETVKKAPLIHKRKIAAFEYPRLLNRACKRLWGLKR